MALLQSFGDMPRAVKNFHWLLCMVPAELNEVTLCLLVSAVTVNNVPFSSMSCHAVCMFVLVAGGFAV